MSKPIYKYPAFVTNVDLKSENGKRYWLDLEIDKNKSDGITVILKNPSRADETISDKTVFNVSNYIYRNREKYSVLENVGNITILNLMPNYLTDSSGLKEFKETIIDQENIRTLNEYCGKNKNVIIAWGNHPSGLYYEYEKLKEETKKILTKNNNQVFYVDKMTNAGNPKHGQVWGYENQLKKVTEL
ncbi:DUF1643 domain-containing protein [Joostella atrarenae]|uniref:DUF1643 domain-containing protein n=1 Tax=Joostella atrarenae TaxID=679257 RepID=A0ABS9J2D9_9FLAO|nr:DUF1643 domain-containing protein [Joostella atrarenae]MCF8714523.1 DUF1643 domain-containing protein [Joostella atrarenae]